MIYAQEVRDHIKELVKEKRTIDGTPIKTPEMFARLLDIEQQLEINRVFYKALKDEESKAFFSPEKF